MGQKLQIDGFAVRRVEVKLAGDVIHACRCRNRIISCAVVDDIDRRPERRGLVRLPAGLGGVRLPAFVEPVRRRIIAAVAFSDSYSIIGTTINAISRPSHKFSLFPFPQLQQL